MKLYNHHTASFTINNGSTQVRDKLTTITTKEVTEFTATATNLTLLATLSAGNYGRLAHIDNLEIAEIFETGEGYRFSYNGGEAINEVYGKDNYVDLGERGVDTRLGRLNWTLDRKAAEYPWQSPYAYYANSPIWQIDYLGMGKTSTHTDKDGNVLRVYNDGDKGVYKHDDAKDGTDIDKKYIKDPGTSAGGTKMGETVTPLSFANFEAYEKDGTVQPAENAKIDFNSNWATNQVDGILKANPSAMEYFIKAGGKGDWDIKNNALKEGKGNYYGSKLYGKYASARDAGNFAAGAVAQNSNVPNLFLDYGFGLYNQSGNNKPTMVVMGATDVLIGIISAPVGVGLLIYRGAYGEDKLSKAGIEAGKAYIKGK